MLRLALFWLLALLWLPAAGAARVTLLTIDGAIGPASADYVVRGIARAAKDGSALVVLRMDTPGGLDTSMRAIIKAILSAPLPVASYVAPGGARAASAGTYIMYASHVAAMAPGTNLGAATPVQIGAGQEREPDEQPATRGPRAGRGGDGDGDGATSRHGAGGGRTGKVGADKSADKSAGNKGAGKDGGAGTDATGADDGADSDATAARQPASPMARKQVNDAAAYIRGLAQMRGRNAEWAERAVREAVSLSAQEALRLRVIDYVAADVPALLAQLDGKAFAAGGLVRRLRMVGATLVDAQPDWRAKLLAVVTNPAIALLLMTLGVYGLIFEFANPGFVVPGVVGAIFLLLGLYALQLLPVNYAGLALILLGLAFMVAEAFLPSFGALGLGGVAAFIAGALILIDTELPGYGIPLPLIALVAVLSALLIAGLVGMAVRAGRRRVVGGPDDLIGGIGEVQGDPSAGATPGEGWVLVRGETWRAAGDAPLRPGLKVRVVAREGLLLRVVVGDNGQGEKT